MFDDCRNWCGTFHFGLEQLKVKLRDKCGFQPRCFVKDIPFHPGCAASLVRPLHLSQHPELRFALSGIMPPYPPDPPKQLHLVLYPAERWPWPDHALLAAAQTATERMGQALGRPLPEHAFRVAVHCEPDESLDRRGHITSASHHCRNYKDRELPKGIKQNEEHCQKGWYADYFVGTTLFLLLVRRSGLRFESRPGF